MAKQPVIWAALKIFMKLLRALPHERAVRLGGALGRAVGRFSRSHAERARARISMILGLDEKRSADLLKRVYDHFGRAAAEFIRMPKIVSRIDEIITSVEGAHHLEEALSLGRGAILLSAHLGHWELGVAKLAKLGMPISAIGADQRDPRITDEIERIRREAGIKPIGKGLDLRAAVESLRSGDALAVLLDQDARDKGIVADFLSHPASTPTGPLRLAQRFGAPVVPARCVRNADGCTFSLFVEPPLASKDGSPFGEDLQSAAQACNDVISRWIRETPEQWLWLYPRWATTLGDR